MKPLLPSAFTAYELVTCAEREIRWRKRVYPNRIDTGRMSREKARREIAMMEAIAELMRERARSETFQFE